MSGATRNSKRANPPMERMKGGVGRKDPDLEALLFEILGETDDGMSWRNLIGRRNVIAPQAAIGRR